MRLRHRHSVVLGTLAPLVHRVAVLQDLGANSSGKYVGSARSARRDQVLNFFTSECAVGSIATIIPGLCASATKARGHVYAQTRSMGIFFAFPHQNGSETAAPLKEGSSEPSLFSAFERFQQVSTPFRSGLRVPRRAKWRGTTLGFEISEALARRARRAFARRVGIITKLAERNADAATQTAAPAKVAGRGRMKPAIRDARASARSAEFRRSLEQSRRVGLRHAWREAETPG
jgi:hypothetical protein